MILNLLIVNMIWAFVSISCIFRLWYSNTKLIDLNINLMKDNIKIHRDFNEKLNDLNARMPGTMWMNTETGKVFVRAKVTEPLKENCSIGKTKETK